MRTYKESVFPSAVTARVSVEMAATFGWERYVGLKGRKVGMHRFGASAPLKDLLKFFGFTVEAVVQKRARRSLGNRSRHVECTSYDVRRRSIREKHHAAYWSS